MGLNEAQNKAQQPATVAGVALSRMELLLKKASPKELRGLKKPEGRAHSLHRAG